MSETDIIGGFPTVSENCLGCGNRLLIGNAWMTDGCPCNTALGVNSMNETRWRLLMQLQQMQANEIETIKNAYKKQQFELTGLRSATEECREYHKPRPNTKMKPDP